MNEAALAATAATARATRSLSTALDDGFLSNSQSFKHMFDADNGIATSTSDPCHMDIDANPTTDRHGVSNAEPLIEKYPGVVRTFGRAQTFMDAFDADCHADKRKNHPYYLFASRNEWELAFFLLRSNLSMNSIDKFFKLELVSRTVFFTLSSNV